MNIAPASDYRPPFPAPYVKVTAFIVANPNGTTSVMLRQKGRVHGATFGAMITDEMLDNTDQQAIDQALAAQFVRGLRALREELKRTS